MRYLAHHITARRVAPSASSNYYVGNILPDLLMASGDGRLRLHHVRAADPANPLVAGVLLHFDTDRRFHSGPAFRAATAEVSALVRGTPFTVTPTRTFFLAHVMVEIALDGWVEMSCPDAANDLIDCVRASGTSHIVEETHRLMGVCNPLPHLPDTVEHLASTGGIQGIRFPENQARELCRLTRRAGLTPFDESKDQHLLPDLFAGLAGRIGHYADELLGFSVQKSR